MSLIDPTGASPVLHLRSGVWMPQLGLGTWLLSDDEAHAAVAQAIERGYRLIDTASMYENEEGVGRGLRDGGVPREDLFVTTKLAGSGHGEREAQEACRRSLRSLELDYLDLYLVHWPLPLQDRYVDAWRGLITLKGQGLVRAIGVSNFKPAHIERLIAETGVVPDVNQIQLNPHVTREAARGYHAGKGIVTQSWSPLGKGVHALLTQEPGATGTAPAVLEEPMIAEIASQHGTTAAQVVLRWHVELGLSVVPKSTNPERLAANIDIFDFELTPAQRDAISSLDQGESAAADSDAPGVGG